MCPAPLSLCMQQHLKPEREIETNRLHIYIYTHTYIHIHTVLVVMRISMQPGLWYKRWGQHHRLQMETRRGWLCKSFKDALSWQLVAPVSRSVEKGPCSRFSTVAYATGKKRSIASTTRRENWEGWAKPRNNELPSAKCLSCWILEAVLAAGASGRDAAEQGVQGRVSGAVYLDLLFLSNPGSCGNLCPCVHVLTCDASMDNQKISA